MPGDVSAGGWNPSKHIRHGIAGAVCAGGMHLVLVPLDVIKTAIQLNPAQFKGFGDTGRQIAKQGWGTRGLLAGIEPTAVGYALQGAGKFGMFDVFSSAVSSRLGHKLGFGGYLACAAAAETLATLALTPFEAARIRMVVAAAANAAGHGGAAPRSMLATMRAIGSEASGSFRVAPLYKGLVPLLCKQLPYTAVQLAAFSVLVDAAYRGPAPFLVGKVGAPVAEVKAALGTSGQLGVSVVCGAVAGVLSSLASQPGDTVLTRINAASKRAAAEAASGGKGAASITVTSVVKELGFKGLWLGTGTRAAFTAILSAGMFLVLDSVKVALGLPSSGT